MILIKKQPKDGKILPKIGFGEYFTSIKKTSDFLFQKKQSGWE